MNVGTGRERVRRWKSKRGGVQTSGLRVTENGLSFMIFLLTMQCDHLQERRAGEWGEREIEHIAECKLVQGFFLFWLPELNFLYFYANHQGIFKAYSVTCKFQEGFRWSSIQTDKSSRLLREELCVLHFTGSKIIINEYYYLKKQSVTVHCSNVYYLWYWQMHIEMLSKSMRFCLWELQWTLTVCMSSYVSAFFWCRSKICWRWFYAVLCDELSWDFILELWRVSVTLQTMLTYPVTTL